MSANKFRVRLATAADVAALHELIEASVRVLQAGDYTKAQMDGALGTVLGVDTQLIADGTYFVVEDAKTGAPDAGATKIVACGGWSMRKTLFGADRRPGREDALLDAARDAAKIRAFFCAAGMGAAGDWHDAAECVRRRGA